MLGSIDNCELCGLRITPANPIPIMSSLFGIRGLLSAVAQHRVQNALLLRASTILGRLNQPVSDAASVEASAVGANEPVLSVHALYADDDATNRMLLTRMLRNIGGSVKAVDDGDKVAASLMRAGMLTLPHLDVLRTAGLPCNASLAYDLLAPSNGPPFDVIILDIVMNRSDGAEVCTALRAVFPVPFPIIAATGNGADPTRLFAAGFTCVLDKPFSQSRVRQSLLLVMNGHTGESCSIDMASGTS